MGYQINNTLVVTYLLHLDYSLQWQKAAATCLKIMTYSHYRFLMTYKMSQVFPCFEEYSPQGGAIKKSSKTLFEV